jgi:hypothetical protein
MNGELPVLRAPYRRVSANLKLNRRTVREARAPRETNLHPRNRFDTRVLPNKNTPIGRFLRAKVRGGSSRVRPKAMAECACCEIWYRNRA